MRLCTPHVNWLLEVLDTHGLLPLVRKKPTSEITDGMGRSIASHGDGPEPFCPLVAAITLICEHAVETAGREVLALEHCPLCEVVRRSEVRPIGRATLDAEWIHGAADDVFAHAIEQKLIPKAS
jgi:hypothetical protein